jgi:hypothetical protein
MAHRCATGISAGTEERWVETTDVAGAGLLEAVCPKCWATAWGPGSMYFAFRPCSGHSADGRASATTAISAKTSPSRAMERTGIEPVTSGLQSPLLVNPAKAARRGKLPT